MSADGTEELQRQQLEQQEDSQYLDDVARLEKHLLLKEKLLKEHQNDAHTSMLHLLGVEAMNNVSQESLDFIANITASVKATLAPMDASFDRRNLLPAFICSKPAKQNALDGTKNFIVSAYVSHEGNSFKKSVGGTLDQTADELINVILSKVRTQHTGFEGLSMNPSDWVLKAQGSAQYLYSNRTLKEFELITNAMNKSQRMIELLLLDANYAINKRASQIVDVELRNVNIIESKQRDDLNSSYDHSKISIEKCDPIDMKVISMWDLKKPLRVKIRGLPGLSFTDVGKVMSDINESASMYVTAELLHGTTSLSQRRRTKSVSYSSSEVYPVWNQYLTFGDTRICDLPKETVLQLTVHVEQKKSVAFAQLRVPLIDYKNIMKNGLITSKMWKISILDGDELRSVSAAVGDAVACSILFELDTYYLPVVFPAQCSGELPVVFEHAYDEWEKRMRKTMPSDIDVNKLIEMDTLHELSLDEKFAIWCAREQLVNNPAALPKFASSVPYKYPKARKIAEEYLQRWKEPTVYDCFELLDFSYADTKMREYAVRRLNSLPDDNLNDFLIQICQCMKSELYHDSPLSRFLLERSFKSPYRIGHSVFWCLKSELHVAPLQERLTTVLRAYLNNCPKHCQQLLKQNDFVDKLLSVAITIKKYSTKVEQQEIMLEKLKDLKHEMCLLPLNPRMEVHGINVPKCKVMGSKKRPLFLFLKNADTGIESEVPNVLVIFKAGDDIRQDTLTLQILKIMDLVWKQDPELGDLFLNPYGCVSTGDMCGFIEVVTRSDTIASVTKQFGGASAALKKTPLYLWLKSKNEEKAMASVVQRFVKSCAAYCVFTYALGIGDRHNDNIMLSETGELLHIDFGHFLGNIKTFAGVRRESAPFVFTKAYCHVICADNDKHDPNKSANFSLFQNLCYKTFQALRTNGNLFMVLLKLMCNSGIPELRTPSDILYMRNTIVPPFVKEDMVYKYMCELITSSLNDKRTKFNEFWHIFANEHIIK